MITVEQVKKMIWEELEYARKRKVEVWEKSLLPNATAEDEFFRHAYIGACNAYEAILELIEFAEEEDGQGR